MRLSTILFLVFTPLGFLTMGAIGGLLGFAVDPLLRLLSQPTITDSTGDSTWPRMILLSLVWPTSFLVAGFLNTHLAESLEWGFPLRLGVYVAALWLGALVWTWLLAQISF